MYHCDLCGDEMDAKFENTHWKLCLIASYLIAPKVESLLFDLDLD